MGVIGSGELEESFREMGRTGALVVDHFDTAIGRISLVRGLAAGRTGYYGVGQGALGLMPDLNETQVAGHTVFPGSVAR